MLLLIYIIILYFSMGNMSIIIFHIINYKIPPNFRGVAIHIYIRNDEVSKQKIVFFTFCHINIHLFSFSVISK